MGSGLVDRVVGALAGANRRGDEAANNASSALGEKLFGSTAESEYRNAEVIAPEASTQPTTVGRRSKHPDGSDPFHGDSSKPDEQA